MLDRLHSQALPGRKALLLTSNGKSARLNGSLDRTVEQLKSAGVGYALFDKIMENPYKSVIMEGAAFARENGCDFILALGGGAVLDSSKAIAAMATNPGDLWDYVYGGTGKCQPLPLPGLPVVTITTTAGTGRQRSGGPRARCLRQYPGRYYHATYQHNGGTFDGACDECLSP